MIRYLKQRKMRKQLATLETLGESAQTVFHYLSDPSHREIARALGMPKSTVSDAIKRLKKHGLTRGEWVLS